MTETVTVLEVQTKRIKSEMVKSERLRAAKVSGDRPAESRLELDWF